MVLQNLDIYSVKNTRPLPHALHQTKFWHLPSTSSAPLSPSHSAHSCWHWTIGLDSTGQLTQVTG